MLKVWLVPVAYVAGIEGFGWFVPYLLFVCAIATLRRMTRARRPLEGLATRLGSSGVTPLYGDLVG